MSDHLQYSFSTIKFHMWLFSTTGYFYAPDEKDESVLSMCTDPDDTRLFTSDTAGCVKIWEIKNYCLKAEDKVWL